MLDFKMPVLHSRFMILFMYVNSMQLGNAMNSTGIDVGQHTLLLPYRLFGPLYHHEARSRAALTQPTVSRQLQLIDELSLGFQQQVYIKKF